MSRLMGKYPVIIYLGAAILGKVAAEMIFTDPAVRELIKIPTFGLYAIEALFAIAVIAVAKLYLRIK